MAVKSYSVGDVIVNDQPIVHVLDYTQKQLRCDYCLFANKSLKCCAKCSKSYYCDRECQTNDWRLHKNECEVYRNHYDSVCANHNVLRLIIRLWLAVKVKSIKLTKTFRLFDETYKCMNDLNCFESEIKRDKRRMKQFEEVCDAFNKCDISYTNETLLQIFGKVLINQLTISNYETDYKNVTIGYGLYACRAIIEHSCAPNACCVFNGFRLQLRAIKDITCEQTVTLSYIALALPKSDRQSLLRSDYFIECKCDKCESNLDCGVDYEKFNLYSSQLYQTILLDDIKGVNCESLDQSVIDDLLVMSSQIYGEYSPSMAVLLMLAMQQKLVNANSDNTRESMSQFISLVGRVIGVSFGCEHKFQIFDLLKNM